jgi:putative ABC transport system permease protein
VLFAKIKLRKNPLDLIKGARREKVSRLTKKMQQKDNTQSFQAIIRENMLLNNLVLMFFMGFAAFGFSCMVQMAFTMLPFDSGGLMIGVFLAFGLMMGLVTLLLSLTFIVNKNKKYLALMRAYGYTDRECGRAMFGGYRIVTYIGFAIGTVWQFFLIKTMASMFAKSHELDEVLFSWLGLWVTLAVFLVAYELILLYYKWRISKIPLKEIMQAT